MIAFLNIFTIMVLAGIAYQDLKDRMVVWILFPILAVILCSTHFAHSPWEIVLWSLLTNILLVSAVLLLLFVYTNLASKKKFLNTSFGLGDVLFFYAFALGFPTITFVVLFVSAICFSLLLFLFLKNLWGTMQTVPLAGFMSLFLIAIVLIDLFRKTPNLYFL